ncbi:MAG: hypothetical protein E4H36_00920 [Spirochaetales bacterium]|nr:MAG: hypothetical protein E4H36_00920 [Spirochaetales bacterium]
MPGFHYILLALFLSFLPVQSLVYALDSERTTLEAEVWALTEPADFEAMELKPVTTDDMRKALLEEARYIFGGMIFGFTFSYVPLDRARGVDEAFSLTPVHAPAWGDKDMVIKQTRVENGFLYCRFSYRLKEYQETWYGLWRSNDYPRASAIGAGNLFFGPLEKFTAVNNAVKEAVREYARLRIASKPWKIEGEALFAQPPAVYIDAGSYYARVRVKLNIKTVVPYLRY